MMMAQDDLLLLLGEEARRTEQRSVLGLSNCSQSISVVSLSIESLDIIVNDGSIVCGDALATLVE